MTLERAAEITSAVSHPERKRDLFTFWVRYFKLNTKGHKLFAQLCNIEIVEDPR